MKALISVYDRTGAIEFAGKLVEAGFEIISTGGTRGELTAAGLPVTLLSDVTGFPEILDGRVKTLHPVIHAGILARRDLDSHVAELSERGIDGIDVVVGNLYPFVETIRKLGVTLEDALENIDIGGPTMIRAAAKNFPSVIVIVDPNDYGWVGERIRQAKALTLEERKGLALKAFRHVAQYDAAVSRYLSDGDIVSGSEFAVGFEKIADMRYGENPHQKGSVYRDPLGSGGIVNAERLHGIEMSFTNYLDAEAAWSAVTDFSDVAACIVKHLNPCGLSVHDDQPTAYRRALEGDPVSAYGGIVAYNRTLTAETAKAMRGVLYHVIVAPDYEPEALDILKRRKETRILKVDSTGGDLSGFDLRLVSGGALLQTADAIEDDPASWQVVTERVPTERELADLAFAWRVCKHIKSNAIVLGKDNTLVGMGTGQPNRVTSIRLAIETAGDKVTGSALASDAFMPFADNIEAAAQAGVASIAQPGGSMRDDEVIEAANREGMTMVFTGVRHFRH
ncbi:MAG: bifunctional phosphoribosylaminoimidazolecarboxamide formyltransferase/IMP cyclohydrolase [Dehalococcoidia bacterium]|nr:bifunctional phosphoribosylaminoimidazolecarboxamide formyltransferase/IMP cyclohydrolase [Dehalococcoidia bacterium]